MQKVFPLLLVLVLAVTAGVFSLRKQGAPAPAPPQVAVAPAKPIPAAGEKVETEKTDTTKKAAVSRPWPQASSDIPADPGAVFGSLPNGMRYVIYPNTEPPKRVSLRLHIAAGSLMEAEDQRGLAHFLEHMVFNGTKHYSAADLIPFLREEATPDWQGNYEFIDAERRTRHPHRIEPTTLRRYLEAYANHFSLWKQTATRYQAPLARIPAETDLPTALFHHALPVKALETIHG